MQRIVLGHVLRFTRRRELLACEYMYVMSKILNINFLLNFKGKRIETTIRN